MQSVLSTAGQGENSVVQLINSEAGRGWDNRERGWTEKKRGIKKKVNARDAERVLMIWQVVVQVGTLLYKADREMNCWHWLARLWR